MPTPGCFNRDKTSHSYILKVRRYNPDGTYDFVDKIVAVSGETQCRQVGEIHKGSWRELPECIGCAVEKDSDYIRDSRVTIIKAMRKDQ